MSINRIGRINLLNDQYYGRRTCSNGILCEVQGEGPEDDECPGGFDARQGRKEPKGYDRHLRKVWNQDVPHHAERSRLDFLKCSQNVRPLTDILVFDASRLIQYCSDTVETHRLAENPDINMTYVYVYVLWSERLKKRYVGSAMNPDERLKEHNRGKERFTKGGIPWISLYTERYSNISAARKREFFLKSGAGRRWFNDRLENKQ